jgi:hypothetical protein
VRCFLDRFATIQHGDDERFGLEIHPKIGIGSVGVRSDDKFVFRVATVLALERTLKGAR